MLQSAKITSRPDDVETSTLIKLGQDFLKNGEFSSGRLLLKRAAKAGSAAAALLLGETFDPFLIQRFGVIGVQPDVAEAREWYQRAAQLGSRTAAQHLATLAAPR
jgi:TPR repeat protein